MSQISDCAVHDADEGLWAGTPRESQASCHICRATEGQNLPDAMKSVSQYKSLAINASLRILSALWVRAYTTCKNEGLSFIAGLLVVAIGETWATCRSDPCTVQGSDRHVILSRYPGPRSYLAITILLGRNQLLQS